jgi:hypothetical protein
MNHSRSSITVHMRHLLQLQVRFPNAADDTSDIHEMNNQLVFISTPRPPRGFPGLWTVYQYCADRRWFIDAWGSISHVSEVCLGQVSVCIYIMSHRSQVTLFLKITKQ